MLLLSRLYVWSIIFDPLLFFILFQRTLFGVPGNVSRILQILVIIGSILKLLMSSINSKSTGLRVVNFASPLYVNWGVYYSLLVVAGFTGLLLGAYDLPASYQQDETLSAFSRILNSVGIRPLFEYVIAAYYFVYFVILPKYILKTEESIIYFFSVFKKIFVISFVIGVIDFGFAVFGVDLVPRHIVDWVHVGMRFHGLAGEPRQAFLYLFLGLAMLHLQAYFIGVKLSKWWIIAIIIAAILTQSASGLLGILAFLGLYIIWGWFNIKTIFVTFSVSALIILLLSVVIINSERIQMYLESASNLWFVLEAGGELPYLMSVQSDSIYPLYDLTVKFRDLDFLPILIGSGLGSASVVNNVYVDVVFGTSNPNSQFVRTLYESGIIGMTFFILAFINPVKHLTKNLHPRTRHHFITYMLLLVGCSFGIRSSVSYIYLGIFIAAFNVFGRNGVLYKFQCKTGTSTI